jgi:hypothetical protein
VRHCLFWVLRQSSSGDPICSCPLQEIGGDTGVIMGEILEARADRIAINITLNSFGTPLNEVRTCCAFIPASTSLTSLPDAPFI